MRIVVAPNSFRNSLTAFEAADAIAQGVARVFPDADIARIPVTDGGDTTMDVLLHACGGEIIEQIVRGPLGAPVQGRYGILTDGNTAVIEMSAASGIRLIAQHERDPLRTTTYGTGELIRAALDRGCRRIIVGVGGSASVDGGAGMLQALGVKLLDSDGRELEPGGGPLQSLARVSTEYIDPRLREADVIVVCDVDNPLLGPQGAAPVFGPQKGANKAAVRLLDRNLTHLTKIVARDIGFDMSDIPHGGAAGGTSAALAAFTGAELRSGIDVVLEMIDFKSALKNTQLMITGEGKLDGQTLRGKAPYGAASVAKQAGLPVVFIAGQVAPDFEIGETGVFDAVLSLCSRPMLLDNAIRQAKPLLASAAEYACRLILVGQSLAKRRV